MKRSIVIMSAIVICLSGGRAAGQSAIPELPGDFADEAYRHIAAITAFGTRSAGSDAEVKTARYIIEKFAESGMEFSIEPFTFDSFEMEACEFLVGGERFDPAMVCFDPYRGQYHFEGNVKCIGMDSDLEELGPFDAGNSVVVIPERVNAFNVMKIFPRLIIIVSDGDYDTIASRTEREFTLDITGTEKQYGSVNVSGTLAPGKKRQIIIGAHIDSFDNLGADDNASGISVMLELARYFKQFESQLDYSVKFIAFGAEELGVVGSRVYMRRHGAGMDDVVLFVNLDTLGGSRICIEGKNVTGLTEEPDHDPLPESLVSRAWEGSDRKWRILTPDIAPYFEPVFYPAWLTACISECIDALGYEVAVTGPLGGDQIVFTRAGIVSASIAAFGNPIHTDEDTLDKIDRESLEKTGRLAAALVHLAGERVAD